MRRLQYMALVGSFLAVVSPRRPYGSLTTNFTFNGNGNWSIDAVGSTTNPVGSLSAVVPVGSTVVQAFLYSSTFFSDTPPSFIPAVNFDGTTISTWTNLGDTSACCGLVQPFRADVTAQVAAKVGGGSAVPFAFSVLSESLVNFCRRRRRSAGDHLQQSRRVGAHDRVPRRIQRDSRRFDGGELGIAR